MADFSHLKDLDVSTERVARFTLHQIAVNGKTPTLLVAPATEANSAYFNALLKRANKSARAVRAGNINTGMIAENREEDRELYPRHVVKGWEDMVDGKTGEDVKFDRDECVNFLANLPDWLFDDIRNFCGNPANFVETVDIETQAKN